MILMGFTRSCHSMKFWLRMGVPYWMIITKMLDSITQQGVLNNVPMTFYENRYSHSYIILNRYLIQYVAWYSI